jgi:predicted membrane-bound mannosyltransferase
MLSRRFATLLGLFLVWDFVVSLVLYSIAGERMPWLTLHPLLPLILLAGIGVQTLWTNRRAVAARVALALGLVACAWSIWTAAALSYGHPADPREMLVFTQTSVDVPSIRDRLAGLDSWTVSHRGRHLRLEVDSWSGTGWPWAWYLRDLPVGYPDMSKVDFRPTGDTLIVTDVNRPALLPLLRDYRGTRFHLRVWWVVDYGGGSVHDWARWFLHRRQWGPLGSTDQWLYVRKRLPRTNP